MFDKPDFARIMLALARSPHFNRLSPASRGRLAAAANVRRFRNGHIVHRRNRYAEGLSIVLSGALRIAWPSPSGSFVPVAVLGEGDFYGVGVFVDNAFVETDCRALGDTDVAHIGRVDIQELIAGDDAIRALVPKLMLNRLQTIVSLYVDLVSLPLPQRLARRLLSHALSGDRQCDPPSECELPMSQADLAQMLGVSRSKVNVELRRLERGRVIKLAYRRLFIRDFPRLRQLAGSNEQET